MNIIDIKELSVAGYEKRALNVFFENAFGKARSIVLEPNGSIPSCKMEWHVLFSVVEGEVVIQSDGASFPLHEGQVFSSEPTTLSMTSEKGARLLGVQIRVKA